MLLHTLSHTFKLIYIVYFIPAFFSLLYSNISAHIHFLLHLILFLRKIFSFHFFFIILHFFHHKIQKAKNFTLKLILTLDHNLIAMLTIKINFQYFSQLIKMKKFGLKITSLSIFSACIGIVSNFEFEHDGLDCNLN